MRTYNVVGLILSCAMLAACSGEGPVFGPILPHNASLSWTALWVQGAQQQPPITFQFVGQNATLTATGQSGGPQPPYTFASGSCVSISGETTNGNVESATVTAAASGVCNITVSGAGQIQANVP